MQVIVEYRVPTIVHKCIRNQQDNSNMPKLIVENLYLYKGLSRRYLI